MSNLFQPAVRSKSFFKGGMTGPSGSGKTTAALRLAKGLGGKIAVIDTENGSASLYSDLFEFDTLILREYHSDKYIDAINAAVSAGYSVVIIDSISHQWIDLLARKEAVDSRGGNSFTNWAKFTPEHDRFKHTIQNSPVHIIATMRSKQDYSMNNGDGKKASVQKLGLAPIQREGAEYEYTTVFDIAMDHNAAASKDRTGLFDGKIEKITEETGKKIANWLNSAKAEAPVAAPIIEAPKVEVPKTSVPSPSFAEFDDMVTKPKATEPPKKETGRTGVPCVVCSKEVVMHPTGAGYACPNRMKAGDGHTSFQIKELAAKQLAATTQGILIA